MASAFSPDQYRALHEGAGFIVREDRGRIVLRGADRKSYLHGLLSNDIEALQPGGSCYATLLTAQGRMISDMRVFDLGDLLLLDLESAVTAVVAEHLDKFVITEDVSVDETTASSGQIGVYGPNARQVLDATVSATGAPPLFVVESSDLGVDGFDVIVPRARVEEWTNALARAGALPVTRDTVDVTRVEAGIPRFLVDMDTATIPLEAGIEERAISMSKGCYVGQEVIVRVLHRGGGRVAKKLVALVLEGEAQRGDRLFAGEREIGRITSAVHSPRLGKRLALGYVQRDFVEPGTQLTVPTADGTLAAVVVT